MSVLSLGVDGGVIRAIRGVGPLLSVLITAAAIQDRDAARLLLWNLKRAFPSVTLAWADGGYAGQLVTGAKDKIRLTVQIVKRMQQHTFIVALQRWVIERTCSPITRSRRTVRDDERLPAHHDTMTHRAPERYADTVV